MSGIDDHSRFVISAQVVARATARPTCEALALAMRRYGCPSEILTDNGKVFTGRFGPGTGEVLFDRICRENGIKHLLTKPRSPTTTGKVERWHKTLRRRVPHRSSVRRRSRMRRPSSMRGSSITTMTDRIRASGWSHRGSGSGSPTPCRSSRWSPRWPRTRKQRCRWRRRARSSARGTISFASVRYKAGVWLAGEPVQVVCDGGLVHFHHRGVVIATHARRHDLAKQTAGLNRRARGPAPHRRVRRRRRCR